MRVLIIDDEKFAAEGLKNFLSDQGIEADAVVRPSYIDAAKDACTILRAIHNEDTAYAALILDIHYQDHFIGGIKVYAKLLAENLRGKFRHLLIWTKYYPSGGVKSDEFKAVEIFRELSFAPPQNVLPKGTASDQKRIVERLSELAKEVNTPVGTYGMWRFH
ncbi:MAG: response regulator [Bryobacterales bacterium]|nr:response regulator [Bryobacterales bacterium]